MKQILVKRTATAGHEDRKHEEMRKNHSVSLNMKLSHFYCVWVFRLERVFQGTRRDIHQDAQGHRYKPGSINSGHPELFLFLPDLVVKARACQGLM